MSSTNVERLLKSVVGGGVAAFAFWVIGNKFQVNGVGWLERQGWPFSDGYLLVAAGVLIGAVVGLGRWRIAAARSQGVEEAARATGFAFQPEVTREELGEAGGLWTFKKWYAGANRQTGLADQLPVEVFDYTYVEQVNKEDKEFTQTVAILPAEAGLPVFELRPRSPMLRLLGIIGMEGVTFDPDQAPPEDARAVRDFRRHYFLSRGVDAEVAENAEALADGETPPGPERHEPIRRLFTTDLLRHFAVNRGWCVDCDGKRLAVWRPEAVVPGTDRNRFLAEVLRVRQVIVRAAEDGAGTVVPASPGTREIAAIQGRLLGAVLGLITGIFLAVSFASVAWNVFGILMPIYFLGTVALGLLTGWFTGGLLLTPGIAFLNRRQQEKRRQAIAISPWQQPYGSTALVHEEGSELTVRFPPGGLIRGGGCALFVVCIFVSLFLIGFSALFVPDALRGEVKWIEKDGEPPQPGKAPATLAPWKALLLLTPFWLAGLITILALVYRARRRALLKVGPDELSIEEVTLFATRRQAWRRDELADVRVVGGEGAQSAVPRLYLVVITRKEEAFSWLGWRDRTEVKWLGELVRRRLGMASE